MSHTGQFTGKYTLKGIFHPTTLILSSYSLFCLRKASRTGLKRHKTFYI